MHRLRQFSFCLLTPSLGLGLTFIGLCLTIFSCVAQKKITVTDIQATCVVTDDITTEEAKKRALEEAKRKALQKAGVSERISTSDVLTTTSDANYYRQVFNSFSTTEIQGEILDYDIKKQTKTTDEFGNFVITLTIDAVVIKQKTKKDLAFDIKIEGVRDQYLHGDALVFSVTPFKAGYLKLFVFVDEKLNYMLYPNDIENSMLLKKQVKFKLPSKTSLSYVLETSKRRELNNLVVVFTKQDVPFMEDPTYKNILKYIYQIAPDQRVVKYFPIEIKNNGL